MYNISFSTRAVNVAQPCYVNAIYYYIYISATDLQWKHCIIPSFCMVGI